MHELSTPELCTDRQGALNSPTVKCVTFNRNLPFGFHNVHYQQWAFSTQAPFRKLSSEKGNNIKKIEKDNASDGQEVLQVPQNASVCVLRGSHTATVCPLRRIKAFHRWNEWGLEL